MRNTSVVRIYVCNMRYVCTIAFVAFIGKPTRSYNTHGTMFNVCMYDVCIFGAEPATIEFLACNLVKRMRQRTKSHCLKKNSSFVLFFSFVSFRFALHTRCGVSNIKLKHTCGAYREIGMLTYNRPIQLLRSYVVCIAAN